MRRLARYCFLIVCALALVGGSTISFAAAAAAVGNPCPHEHRNDVGSGPQSHKHHGAGCLSCCLGACVVVPDLPPRTSVGMVHFTATAVSYWEQGVSLSSRSIAPDPGPPRISARRTPLS